MSKIRSTSLFPLRLVYYVYVAEKLSLARDKLLCLINLTTVLKTSLRYKVGWEWTYGVFAPDIYGPITVDSSKFLTATEFAVSSTRTSHIITTIKVCQLVIIKDRSENIG